MKKESYLKKIHWEMLIPTALILGTISVLLFVNPGPVSAAIEGFKWAMVNAFTPFYLVLGLGCVLFLAWICFSKFGGVRLGHKEPEFKTFSWIAMMFCAGMGSSLLYWSAVEWMYYYSAPPLGAEPFSQVAAELSMVYGAFHWGITPWAIYLIGGLALAHRHYNHRKPELTLSATISGLFGEDKFIRGPWGKVTDTLFLIALIAGQCITLGTAVPMFSNNFSRLTGVSETFALNVGIMLFVAVVFTISSWMGLAKGMKNLSTWTAYAALGLAAYVLIVGPTEFMMGATTQMLGYQFQNFIHMSLWTDFVGQGGFPQAWTAFYWVFWSVISPLIWIYVARISRGRTLRQVVMGMVVCGALGDWTYYGTISPFGLHQQLTGQIDLIAIMDTEGAAAAISALVLQIPGGKIILVAWMLIGITLLATSLDAVTFTLATSSSKPLAEGEEPNRIYRLVWTALLVCLPMGFMYANAPLGAIQAFAFVFAVPIGVITILSMINLVRYLQKDYGKMTADQIVASGTDPDFVTNTVLEEQNLSLDSK